LSKSAAAVQKGHSAHEVSSLDPVYEIVGVAFGAARAERHLSERPRKFAGSAGDGEYRVCAIVERPLDRQLTLLQVQRPEALPGFAWHRTEADALVGADLVLVVCVVNLVREGEDVASTVA